MLTLEVDAVRAFVLVAKALGGKANITILDSVTEVDENADFTELRRSLKGAVVFKLGEVRRINSCGVREWVNFVRDRLFADVTILVTSLRTGAGGQQLTVSAIGGESIHVSIRSGVNTPPSVRYS